VLKVGALASCLDEVTGVADRGCVGFTVRASSGVRYDVVDDVAEYLAAFVTELASMLVAG
jgi:hypothetical protein